VAELISRLSLREKVGQLLMPALSYGPGGSPATRVHEALAASIRDVQPGGVIFFGPNINTVEQTASLIDELSALSSLPLFFAIDEEGGTVSRLRTSGRMGATEIPPARVIGRLGDPQLARQVGEVIGRELRALGFNLNLAPVADVLTNRRNSVIGKRSFGTDPDAVADMVAHMIYGLQSQNVGSVMKHFPGHGATEHDSHQGPVTVPYGLDRLRQVELVPFRAGIEAGAEGIMAGHISAPQVTGHDLPATLSPGLLQELLRDTLRFDGLIVSDSLSMQAVTGLFPQEELAVRAVEAGVDVVLDPQNPEVARNAIVAAVRSGRLSEARIDRSVARILRTKLDLRIMSLPEDLRVRNPAEEPGPPAQVLGQPAHQRVIEEVRARAHGSSAQ
jgi:beta-N-acetylhexosaminidase